MNKLVSFHFIVLLSPDTVWACHIWPRWAAGSHKNHWQGCAKNEQRPELLPVSDCELRDLSDWPMMGDFFRWKIQMFSLKQFIYCTHQLTLNPTPTSPPKKQKSNRNERVFFFFFLFKLLHSWLFAKDFSNFHLLAGPHFLLFRCLEIKTRFNKCGSTFK